jgi:hypothetical protein
VNALYTSYVTIVTMDSHQGAAGFAFDMNMDFSTVFPKPNEGETSNGFFFGDEGIDTTTTFVDPLAMFSQQTSPCYDIQQGLVSASFLEVVNYEGK